MAINFLNTVDLNQNQLNKAAIQNLASNPASGVEGQIYFNTVAQTIKVYKEILPSTTPATYEWASISGDITEVQASAVNNKLGINVVDQLGPIPKVGLDIVGLTALGAPALDDSLAIYDKSTTTNKKLTVADIIGTSTWKLEGDGANPQTIVNGDTVDFVGDTYITATASSVSANNFKVNFDHDDTTRPANTTSTDSPGYSGTFTVIDSVTSNATGHVTAANELTITLPADTNETYTLPTTAGVVAPGAPTTGIISLTAGGTGSGVKNTVTFTGTSGRIDVSGSTTGIAGAITIDLTDDVIIVDDLTVGGVITQTQTLETNSFASELDMNNTKLLNVKTGTAGTDGVNLAQVESLVAGLGSFQGGYDATNNPGSPALTGSSNVAIGNGDFYVVTAPGVITFSDTPTGDATLEVGDFIFANTNIAINSNPPSTSFTLVIADANVAGVGATDGATEKGVAGFDSAHFTATANGWIQLKERTNPNGRKQSLNNTAPSSRAESGGVTTFTLDLANSILFDTGALSEDVAIEVTEGAAPYETVYAHVNRSGSASMTVAFTGSVANDAYQVLLTYVG